MVDDTPWVHELSVGEIAEYVSNAKHIAFVDQASCYNTLHRHSTPRSYIWLVLFTDFQTDVDPVVAYVAIHKDNLESLPAIVRSKAAFEEKVIVRTYSGGKKIK